MGCDLERLRWQGMLDTVREELATLAREVPLNMEA